MRVAMAAAWLAAALLPGAGLKPALASEVCGIPGALDSLFANGFQVPVANSPLSGALQTNRSVLVSAAGSVVPTITISYPTAGTTVPGNGVAVTGTFSGPADTGVTVNGVIAYTQGTHFFAPAVPLPVAGANNLTATAKTLVGDMSQASVSVTPDGVPAVASLLIPAPTGFAPFTAAFSAGLPSSAVASQIRLDFDGDGTDDFSTTDANASLAHVYALPGTYTARLTVVDNTTSPGPTTYVAYKRVMAQDVVEVRETLCSVYGHLRTSLAAGDVTTAVLAISPDARAHYQTLFSSISMANRPVAASRLGTIADGIIAADFAHLKVVKLYQGSMASFPLSFSRDDDGVWRIDGL